MPSSLRAVQKVIKQIRSFMHDVKTNASSLTTRATDTSPYRMVDDLRRCSPAFLTHPEALDLLIEIAPEIEAYRGKGTQTFNDGLHEIINSIRLENQYRFQAKKDFSYSDEITSLVFQKIAHFALLRAKGNGQKLRSRRPAEIRKKYWEILSDLAESHPLPETLPLAKTTARNEAASLPERSGAIGYLLTHLTILNEETPSKTDPEIEDIVGDLRNNPPSRDTLFDILDHGVNSGAIDQMSAMFDLEDWDEQNED